MAEWTNEAREYLDGYLKQVAVLVREQGDDPDDIVDGLRDHIANEVEADNAGPITVAQLLPVLSDLGSPEAVASVDASTLRMRPTTPSEAKPSAPLPTPAIPRKIKSVVVHRSPASCAIAGCLVSVGLVVGLAVLSIVAAVVLPAFARAREDARRAACQTNLKQLHLGLTTLASESPDRRFPPIDLNYQGVMFDIDELFPPIIKDFNTFICPSGPNAGTDPLETADEYTYDYDYVYFSHVVTTDGEAFAYLDAVANAKATDTPLTGPITLDDGTVLEPIESAEAIGGVDATRIPLIVERSERHIPNGFHVLFLDGHVEYAKIEDARGFLWTHEFIDAVERNLAPAQRNAATKAVD